MKKLWRFKGGIKIDGFKSLSNTQKIKTLPVPEYLYLPLRQHTGSAASVVVSIGEKVYKGQCIARETSAVSAPVHASSSGTVVAIKKQTIAHHSGVSEQCVIIETDGKDEWTSDILSQANSFKEKFDRQEYDLELVLARIKEAGIVGLGGAVFPSAAKLNPKTRIETLILNGVECEPYITCDDVLMREHANRIFGGILLLCKLLQPRQCFIAIEDNKPQAIKSMQRALKHIKETHHDVTHSMSVVPVPTLFPAGGEKQLIKVLTGKAVPKGGLPFHIGVVCINVGTSAAINDAVYHARPLVSRIVTVTGTGVKRPGNYEVPLGTPVQHLLDVAGGDAAHASSMRLIMGGPMMGQSLPHANVPIVKASNCILVEDIAATQAASMPCIRCGACTQVCPMHLLPQQLYWHARGNAFEKLQHHNLNDCIECGCCAVVCPSKIPLVHYFRYAKTEKAAYEAKQKMADQSRQRMLLREERLKRIEQENAEKKARRKAERMKNKRAKSNARAQSVNNPQENSKTSDLNA